MTANDIDSSSSIQTRPASILGRSRRVISPPRAELGTLRTLLNAGEIKVLDFFDEHLPLAWEIYIQPHLNGLRPDFVLLHPQQGIAVFEVKDWKLSTLRAHRGEHPVDTVERYKQEIYELYCPRLEERYGFGAITAGLIFPNADSQLLAHAEQRRKADRYRKYPDLYPLVGQNALASGDLSRVFARAATGRGHQSMSDDIAADLRHWLIEPDFAAEQRKLPALTRKQKDAINKGTASGYRRIKGPAGSGKSLVLAGRAAKLAAEGKDVLVVTYNITLRNYLMDLAVRFGSGKLRSRVTWFNFHHWLKRAASESGQFDQYNKVWRRYFDDATEPSPEDLAQSPELAQVLNEQLPRLVDRLIEADDGSIHRYDAILVDEGQDFQPLWWNLLRKVCKPGGEMLLVADATQDIYGTAKSWTEQAMTGAGFPGGEFYKLDLSHRLPPLLAARAAAFATTFLPEEVVDIPTPAQPELGLEPCHLKWVQPAIERHADSVVSEAVALLRDSGHASPAVADLTIQVDSTRIGTEVIHRLNKLGYKTIHTFGDTVQEGRRRKLAFYMGDARVKVTTVKSFKGWESNTMVMSITRADTHPARAGVYTALTRLKRSPKGSQLTVVCSASELWGYGDAWKTT